MRFKKGDKVRCISLDNKDYSMGKNWTLDAKVKLGSVYTINGDNTSDSDYITLEGLSYSVINTHFELVEEHTSIYTPNGTTGAYLTPQEITTKQEETHMKYKKISLTVTTAPVDSVTTNTIYGMSVEDMSEDDLHGSLVKMQARQDALKELGTKESSKRITKQIKKRKKSSKRVTKQIKKRKEARKVATKLIKAIDY